MKDKRIEVRVSEPEHEKIKENAEREKMTLSEYLRNQAINGCGLEESPKLLCCIATLLQEAEDQLKDKDDKEILRQVGKRIWNI